MVRVFIVFGACCLLFCFVYGARCTSVVRAFAHIAIGRRIDPL